MEYKYKRTVTLLLKELEKDPTNIYYRYQLGVSYSMYGKLKEASIEFEKAYNLLRTQKSDTKKKIRSFILPLCKNSPWFGLI